MLPPQHPSPKLTFILGMEAHEPAEPKVLYRLLRVLPRTAADWFQEDRVYTTWRRFYVESSYLEVLTYLEAPMDIIIPNKEKVITKKERHRSLRVEAPM